MSAFMAAASCSGELATISDPLLMNRSFISGLFERPRLGFSREHKFFVYASNDSSGLYHPRLSLVRSDGALYFDADYGSDAAIVKKFSFAWL